VALQLLARPKNAHKALSLELSCQTCRTISEDCLDYRYFVDLVETGDYALDSFQAYHGCVDWLRWILDTKSHLGPEWNTQLGAVSNLQPTFSREDEVIRIVDV